MLRALDFVNISSWERAAVHRLKYYSLDFTMELKCFVQQMFISWNNFCFQSFVADETRALVVRLHSIAGLAYKYAISKLQD